MSLHYRIYILDFVCDILKKEKKQKHIARYVLDVWHNVGGNAGGKWDLWDLYGIWEVCNISCLI